MPNNEGSAKDVPRGSRGATAPCLVASHSAIFFFFINYDEDKFVTSRKTWAEINMQIMVPVWDAISLISIHWHNCVLQIYEFCKCHPIENAVFSDYSFTSMISNNTWIHRKRMIWDFSHKIMHTHLSIFCEVSLTAFLNKNIHFNPG